MSTSFASTLADVTAIASLRAKLWDGGYRPIAVLGAEYPDKKRAGKAPLGRDWADLARCDPPDCLNYPPVPHAPNTGVLSDELRAVDIDVEDPDIAWRIRTIALSMFGDAPIRIRPNSPRCLLPYRAATGSPKKRTVVGRRGKVEVLGHGQQFVAFGTHPSGAELRWEPASLTDVPRDNLPAVTEEQVSQFLNVVRSLIEAPPEARSNNAYSSGDHEDVANILDITAALAVIPNNDPANWEHWNNVGMATWLASGGSVHGRNAWCAWSAKHPEHDDAACGERWLHYQSSPPDRTGAGKLFKLAARAVPGWQKPSSTGRTKPQAAEPTSFFDPWDLPTPPPFPMDVLPDVLRAFAEDRARVIGADPAALAWSAISACSAAIDGRVRLRMKRNDGWSVPPAIWIALVGRSSTKKTPIIEAAWEPLQRVQAADMHDWKLEHDDWKRLTKSEREDVPEPMPTRRLVTHDGTMEAVQEILGRQGRGMGVLRDELAGWIGSMEKYSSGRGSAADRAFWLQAFNGSPHVVDRVGRGNVAIDNLLVTICGGIQPDRMRQFSDLTDDGLWQRFVPILVGPASVGRDEYSGKAIADYDACIQRLLKLSSELRPALAVGVHEIRADVEQRAFELEQSEVLGARFASFCGKLHGLWGRLALVLACIDPQPTPAAISKAAGEAAHALLFQNALPNAARIYAATGGSGANEEATRAIAGYLLAKKMERVVASDLTSNVRICRGRTIDEVQRFVSPLVAGGWMVPEREFNPVAWNVSPGVHAQFAARAAQETHRRAEARRLILGAADE